MVAQHSFSHTNSRLYFSRIIFCPNKFMSWFGAKNCWMEFCTQRHFFSVSPSKRRIKSHVTMTLTQFSALPNACWFKWQCKQLLLTIYCQTFFFISYWIDVVSRCLVNKLTLFDYYILCNENGWEPDSLLFVFVWFHWKSNKLNFPLNFWQFLQWTIVDPSDMCMKLLWSTRNLAEIKNLFFK